MSTPLMFSGFQLLEIITKFYFYPHIIYFSPETRGWVARSTWSRTLRAFYFSNVILFGFIVVANLLQVFKYMTNAQNHATGVAVIINVCLFLGSCVSCSLNFFSFNNATKMVEYINAVLNFEQNFVSKCNTGDPLKSGKFIFSVFKLIKIGMNFTIENFS